MDLNVISPERKSDVYQCAKPIRWSWSFS